MERITQFSVTLENKPGRLANVCRSLAERSINIIALSVAETTEQGILRLVVDKPKEAAGALKQCALPFTQMQVLLVELPNKVGVAALLAEKLSAKRVNISFVYGSTGKGRGKTFLVVGASNLKSAEKALAKL